MDDGTRLADASQLIEAARAEIEAASPPEALEEVRVRYLGRRGHLTLMMRELGALDPDARRRAGAELNDAKDRITAALSEAAVRLRGGGAGGGARRRGGRCDPAGAIHQRRAHPSDQSNHRRDRRDLWRDGLRRCQGA